MEIRRRCPTCNVRLVKADETEDKLYVFCPKCGKVNVFISDTPLTVALKEISEKPTTSQSSI